MAAQEEENASGGEGEGDIDGATSGCDGVEVDETRGNDEAGKRTGSARDSDIAWNMGEGDAMNQEGQDQSVGQADGAHESGEQGLRSKYGTHLNLTRTEPSTTAHSHTGLDSLPVTTTGNPSEIRPHYVLERDMSMGEDQSLLAVPLQTEAIEIQSTRGMRKRKAISHLSDCLCGVQVSADEIAQAVGVIHCKKPGCETEWVSFLRISHYMIFTDLVP